MAKLGRPARVPGEKRRQVRTYVSDSELRAVKEAASKSVSSVSEFSRSALLRAVEQALGENTWTKRCERHRWILRYAGALKPGRTAFRQCEACGERAPE
jgi:hypothetical protein